MIIEYFVLDEADRMLDMGFIPDVRKIIHSTPSKDKRQTLLFSATLTGQITRLASEWTRSPVTVEIEPEQVAVDTVEQIVYIVTTDEKFCAAPEHHHPAGLRAVPWFSATGGTR